MSHHDYSATQWILQVPLPDATQWHAMSTKSLHQEQRYPVARAGATWLHIAPTPPMARQADALATVQGPRAGRHATVLPIHVQRPPSGTHQSYSISMLVIALYGGVPFA